MSLIAINHTSLAPADIGFSLDDDDNESQMITVCFGDHKVSVDRQLAKISGVISAKLKTIQCEVQYNDDGSEKKEDEEDEVILNSKLATKNLSSQTIKELFGHVVNYMTACGQYNDFHDAVPKNPTDHKTKTPVVLRAYSDGTEVGTVTTTLETISKHFVQTNNPLKLTLVHEDKDVTEGGSLWITHFKSTHRQWGFARFARGTDVPDEEDAHVVVDCREFPSFNWDYSNIAKEVTDVFAGIEFNILMNLANVFNFLQIPGGLDLICLRISHICRSNHHTELKKMAGHELTDDDEKEHLELQTIREERLKAAAEEEKKEDDK